MFTNLLYNKGCHKGYTDEQPDEIHRMRSGRALSTGASVPVIWGMPASQYVLINLEALQIPYFGDFYGGLIIKA